MKRILIIFTTMALVFSLVACGNEEIENASIGTTITEAPQVDMTQRPEESTPMPTEQPIQQPSNTENESEDSSEVMEPVENGSETTGLVVDDAYVNLPVSQGFVFESNGDGTCTLTEIGVCQDENIVIPQTSPTGDKVTLIGEYAFYNAEDVTSIVFAGLVMKLDNKAFQSCDVEKIVITGCELEIGGYAFSYCEDVAELEISNSTLEVESYAFYDFGKDMSVSITDCTGSFDEKAFQTCLAESFLIKDCTLEIDDYAFSYCEDITSVLFENCKLEIGSYVFYDSGDDAEVKFVNCDSELDDKAFQSCGLVSLFFVDGEVVIGDYVFSYCEDLTDVVIETNNIEIGTYAFYDCTELVTVSIAANSDNSDMVIVIDDKAFQSSSVQNVLIGKGKIDLGDYAFSYCEELVSVEIQGTINDIGTNVFYDCPDELVIDYQGVPYNKKSIETVK